MISVLTLIATVIIPTIILLLFIYAKILTQQNKHEVVFYILATTFVFTLIIWIYQMMGDPFRIRGNLGYFIDKLGLDKCSIEGLWGGSSPTKPKYKSDKDDDSEWSKEKCKSNLGEDVDSDKYATEEEMEGFTEIYYSKFILYSLLVGYVIYYNYGKVGEILYTLFMSNTALFGLWLLFLIMPYESKDFALWPESISFTWIMILSWIGLAILASRQTNVSAKSLFIYITLAITIGIIRIYVDELPTSFGPEKFHKTSSLGYYIKRLGLNKETDKLKYDIYIRDEDLDTNCKIVGTWSKKVEIPKITGDMEGCSLDTLGIDVGI
jgi:hypothetical protein